MNKMGSAAKVKLNSFDDLFGTEQPQAGTEQVQEIVLSELHEFKGHPFKVLDDEKMQETVESVREHGVLMVDSNIQREDILPSEKAKAYRMKYDAMKHQGKKGVGNSLDEVGEAQERVARLFRGISIFQDYLTNC